MRLLNATIEMVITMTTLRTFANPPAIELTRPSIDGGGAMHSTGVGCERSATVGQPDVGDGTMAVELRPIQEYLR